MRYLCISLEIEMLARHRHQCVCRGEMATNGELVLNALN